MSHTRVTKARLVTALACAAALHTLPVGPAPLARAGDRAAASAVPQAVEAAPTDIRFEANLGQVAGDARFVARFPYGTLLLTPRAAELHLVTPGVIDENGSAARDRRRTTLGMRFVEANPDVAIVGVEQLPGRSHYFRGSDPSRWVRDVPSYAAVRYEGLYPGVDLLYIESYGSFQYTFVVAPGSSCDAIGIAFDGATGVDLDAAGRLTVATDVGPIPSTGPYAFQNGPNEGTPVTARFVRRADGRLGFEVGAHDPALPLFVSPLIAFDTRVPNTTECLFDVAADRQGDLYATGVALDFDAQDALVRKLDASGALVYESRFVNGYGYAVAVDAAGCAYVAGGSASADFTTTPTAARRKFAGGDGDGFVLKLSPTGSDVVYSTLLGGSGDDRPLDVALDSANRACVVGVTGSKDFPVSGPARAASGAKTLVKSDAFATMVDASGASFVFSTVLGGTKADAASAVAIDGSGRVYVVGYTQSRDFRTVKPVKRALVPTDANDVFVTKLAPSGSPVIYSTFFGGSQGDVPNGAMIDPSGDLYVCGTTRSPDFPVKGGFQTTMAGVADGFVAKLDGGTGALLYSTLLGGSQRDSLLGMALTPGGELYVTGMTWSPDFPRRDGGSVPPPPPDALDGDAVVAKIGAAGSVLAYSTTYRIGQPAERGKQIVLGEPGSVYVLTHYYSSTLRRFVDETTR